jgi:tRNA dimethylallyltransferase
MYAAGLVEETRALIECYGDSFPALSSIGYAEAAQVVAGEWDVETAIARTQTETHRLLRLQARWFRDDDERIQWIDGAGLGDVVAAVEAAAHAPVR